jgi:hypothetical protein
MDASAFARECLGLAQPIRHSPAKNAVDNIIEIVSRISTGQSMNRDGNVLCAPASKAKYILIDNSGFDRPVVCLTRRARNLDPELTRAYRTERQQIRGLHQLDHSPTAYHPYHSTS